MSAEAPNGGGTARRASCSSLDAPRRIDLNGPADRPFTPLPDNALERPLFETFAAVVERAPDAIALEDGEAALTYGEVLHQALNLAQIISLTVERGEPIGIALPNGVTYPVAMLAALAAGRPFVPLDLTFPVERNALIVRHSGMKAIIVDHSTRAAMRAIEGAPPPLDFAEGVTNQSTAALAASLDDIARIIYTSGSEGRPKGVYKTQRTVLHQTAVIVNAQHLSPSDRHILLISPATSASQNHIWASVLSGARVVMVDLRRHGMQEAVRVMAHRGITTYASAPFVFRRLMELCRDPASVATIRLVNLMTDRVFASDLALFRERFPETCLFSTNIGSSEASTYCSWFIPRDMDLDRPLVPGGYTLPDFEVSVVDDAGGPVPRGEVGEITVAGHFVAEGYWRDEDLTRRAFSFDRHDPKRRINRTGDLGRMRADGLIEMVGRRDRQLKIRGLRVEPTEIEATLRTHPAVRDAAVIPRPAGDSVEIVVYASPRSEAPAPQPAELAAWVGTRLPPAMRPRFVYVVDELPLLGNFKPDIRALEVLDRARAASDAASAGALADAASPSDAGICEAVRSRWQRVLGRASFDANFSWDDAGGDSLKALELIFALEELLGRPVDMAVLGPATRPSDLITALQLSVQTPDGGVAGQATGQRRLFFLPGYSGLVFHEARLVQSLAHDMKIEVLEYPPVVPTRLQPIRHSDVVAHVVRAIQSRRRLGERVSLLGYSYGGHVAFDAACRLKAEGVDLAYVGIVDVSAPGQGPVAEDIAIPTGTDERRPTWLDPLRRLWTVVTLPRYAFDRLITIGIDHEDFARLAWMWRALVLLRLRSAQVRFRVLTMRLLRLRALVRHAYERYPGPVSLFYALDNKGWSQAALPHDLGWGDWCEGVDVSPIPGDHIGMLAPGNLVILTRAILSQFERAIATAGHRDPLGK